MAQKGLWNVAGENLLEDRGALPKKDGYQLREYRRMKIFPEQLAEEGCGRYRRKKEVQRGKGSGCMKAEVVKERWKEERRKR